MPEVNQYSFSLREMLELLMRKSDVHEGEWTLTVGLQVGVGTYGPTPEQTFPGAAVTIHQIGIQRHPPGNPTGPGAIVADAAKMNPAPSAPKVTSKKKKK